MKFYKRIIFKKRNALREESERFNKTSSYVGREDLHSLSLKHPREMERYKVPIDSLYFYFKEFELKFRLIVFQAHINSLSEKGKGFFSLQWEFIINSLLCMKYSSFHQCLNVKMKMCLLQSTLIINKEINNSRKAFNMRAKVLRKIPFMSENEIINFRHIQKIV